MVAKSYNVLAVDPIAKTIVIAFTQDGETINLNINAPDAGMALDDQVLASWPTGVFARRADATITTDAAEAMIGQAAIALAATGPTPAEVYTGKIALGIVITSTGTPTINATYGIDDVTVNQIKGVANDFASGLGLPGGAAAFTYPVLGGGEVRQLSGPNVTNLYKAMRDLRAVMDTQFASLSQGGPATWPQQAKTIP